MTSKIKSSYEKLKSDPDIKEAMIPVPDYAMAMCILLMRVEKKLDLILNAKTEKK